MKSLHEWKITILVIKIKKLTKISPMTKKTAQPMKMAPLPTQTMQRVPYIPLQPLPTIIQKITNKRQWITTL